MWTCTNIKSVEENNHDFILTFQNDEKKIDIFVNIFKDTIDTIIKEYTESFNTEPPIEVDKLQNLLYMYYPCKIGKFVCSIQPIS